MFIKSLLNMILGRGVSIKIPISWTGYDKRKDSVDSGKGCKSGNKVVDSKAENTYNHKEENQRRAT